MSKAGSPRFRYVALRIEAERSVSRRALANAITGRARHEGLSEDAVPQLTRCEHPYAIVRCRHVELAATSALLTHITWVVEAGAKVPVTITTLSASGTIRTLTDRLGILKQRGEPPSAAPANSPRRAPQAPRGPRAPPPAARAPAPGRGPAPARAGDPGLLPARRRRSGPASPSQGL